MFENKEQCQGEGCIHLHAVNFPDAADNNAAVAKAINLLEVALEDQTKRVKTKKDYVKRDRNEDSDDSSSYDENQVWVMVPRQEAVDAVRFNFARNACRNRKHGYAMQQYYGKRFFYNFVGSNATLSMGLAGDGTYISIRTLEDERTVIISNSNREVLTLNNEAIPPRIEFAHRPDDDVNSRWTLLCDNGGEEPGGLVLKHNVTQVFLSMIKIERQYENDVMNTDAEKRVKLL